MTTPSPRECEAIFIHGRVRKASKLLAILSHDRLERAVNACVWSG
jgi:hypothetical protein